MSKRIISLLVAFVICISASPVCCADSDGAYISKTSSYWDTMLHGIVNGTSGVFLLSSGVQGIASFLNGDICALSSDGYHYADSLFSDHVGEGKDGAKYAEAICKFCGEHFLCYATDLPPAYDDYVQTLPAPGYSSSGELHWRLNVDRVSESAYQYGLVAFSGGPEYSVFLDPQKAPGRDFIVFFSSFVAPVTGNYTLYCYFDGAGYYLERVIETGSYMQYIRGLDMSRTSLKSKIPSGSLFKFEKLYQ